MDKLTVNMFSLQHPNTNGNYSLVQEDELEDSGLSWLNTLEKISHWLLIVNSSCNIVIYLHKDPKFKVEYKLL